VQEPRNTAYSQSLERGLAILSAFRSGRPLLGVSDLAREVGLSRSTTHRYIATLAGLGYLQQDPATRKYRLGPRVLDLGFSAINSMDLRELAVPHLQALSDETGHTVNMAVLDGADIVYIERCRTSQQGQREIDLNLHVGSRLPAYCTSMGKVLLAYRDPVALRALLDRMDLARRGPKTITVRDQLVSALAKVRQAGVAVNDEELAPGLRSIAAPIRDRSAHVVAAINVAVHLTTWTTSVESVISRLSGPLLRCAADISHQLGYRPRP
jgi:IclR family pca regulon transcriptional regulator